MAIPMFLAQTAAEFHACPAPPKQLAWMACHFSPYGTGLSNLPPVLPEGSLLILNDRIPLAGHDPERIAEQLCRTAEALGCSGILLDFQRGGSVETRELCSHLAASLPCPVVVSDLYAAELWDCPVFLRPCPHHVPLADHLAPWKGRRVWLDLARNAETITLTKAGARIHSLPLGEAPEGGHADRLLHCHYSMETGADAVQFTLWRTGEDLDALAAEAEALAAEALVGLYCELGARS